MFNFNYITPKIVAEIGCNHKGELPIAKELISLAKEAGVKYVKFQKRYPRESLTEEQYNSPHPNLIHSYGTTYGEHREKLEFTLDQHKILKEYCESLSLVYSTSVWDVTSANEIISLSPEFIKVPSACNNNFEMLKLLRDNYSGEVHISLGMTTYKESEDVINFFTKKDHSQQRLVVYACTSGYPVPFKDISLLEINNLYKNYEDRVKEIGFSGHHLGIAIDVAAYTLGARWIERHFTKDRTWKGTDHAASLEPAGLKKLVRDLNASYEALTYKKSEILDIELPQREKLKFKPNV